MTTPAPDLTQYRITLFFGPDSPTDQPETVQCVFNVKKRSWKGGVQVAVDVEAAQLAQARARIDYAAWLQQVMPQIPPEERAPIMERADDLFAQAYCACVLEAALLRGLEQDNQRLTAATYADDLDARLTSHPTQLTDRIRRELDLDDRVDV